MPRFSRPVNIVVFVLILVPCLARGAMADLRSGVVSNGGAAPSERTPALGQSYSSLFSFSGADGETPTTGLVAVKRTLYGTAPGGANGFGIVYTITKAGRERVAYSFQGPPDGESPGPLLNIDGQLYGATAVGGSGTLCKSSSGCGAVFRFDPKTRTGSRRLQLPRRFGRRRANGTAHRRAWDPLRNHVSRRQRVRYRIRAHRIRIGARNLSLSGWSRRLHSSSGDD